MATPKGVEAQEVPGIRAPRRCPFLNTAGDGTQWDPRREEHSPLFVPLGFLVPVSQNPSWEAFSLVSGCNGGVVIPRFPSVPPSRPSGYPVPSPESAGILPLVPKASTPIHEESLVPPFAGAPSEEGAEWQTFSHEFCENGRD